MREEGREAEGARMDMEGRIDEGGRDDGVGGNQFHEIE